MLSSFRKYSKSSLENVHDFMSHLLGKNSNVAPVVSMVLEMLLNLILAFVCIGYITTILTTMFPAIQIAQASFLAACLLLCALPFELLNTDVQNGKKEAHQRPGFTKNYPLLSILFAYISTTIGAFQYLIRNFNLVKSFTATSTGVKFMRGISRTLGIFITGSKFSIIGAVIGFIAHWLLAFGNWDALTSSNEVSVNGYFQSISQAMWVLLAAWGLSYFTIPPLLISSIALGVFCIGLIAQVMQEYAPMGQIKAFWLKLAVVTMPLGALLYTLVDFFTSYALIEALGLVSPVTTALCLFFGVFSWCNVMLLWGYNVVKSEYSSTGEPVDSLFAKLYYSDASVRRVSNYVKELMLLGLDLFNNKLSLDLINYVLLSVTGLTVSLTVINLCSVFYFFNKLAILYFQSSESSSDTKGPYENINVKQTACARACNYILGKEREEFNPSSYDFY